MTTYILHGGNVSTPSPKNQNFFKHFTSHVEKSEVSIALIYWARPLEKWAALTKRDQNFIQSHTEKKLQFFVPESPAELHQLMPTLDVIFVAGGDAEPIEALLPQLDWLKSALQGKVYLGSSMGAFIAAKNYVLSDDAADTTTVHQGLELLPLQILCHWDQEPHQTEKKQLLTDYDSTLPIITLNEGECIVFEQ